MPLLSGFKWLTVESPAEQALRHKIAGYAIWLDFFCPFSPVEEFYVSRRPGLAVAFALAGATGQAEILPALRSIFESLGLVESRGIPIAEGNHQAIPRCP